MIDQERLAKAVEHAQWVVGNSWGEPEELDEAVKTGHFTEAQVEELSGYLSGCMGCEVCQVRIVMDAMWVPMYSLIAGDIADRLEMDAAGFTDKGLANGLSAVAKMVRQMRSVED